MSIFHWPDSNGEEVCRYEEHLAEVERVMREHVCVEQDGDPRQPWKISADAAEAMRAACIAAVEALPLYPVGSWDQKPDAVLVEEVLADLREVEA